MLLSNSFPILEPPIPLVPLAENPLFDEWLDAIEKYREEKEP